MNEIGIECFYQDVIEEYPCENKKKLREREGYWKRVYQSNDNGYNKKIETRTQKNTIMIIEAIY